MIILYPEIKSKVKSNCIIYKSLIYNYSKSALNFGYADKITNVSRTFYMHYLTGG